MSSYTPQPVEPAIAVARPDALKVLLDASALLLARPGGGKVLAGVVDLARRVIDSDAYAVWRTCDGLTWRIVASYGLSGSYRTELRTEVPVRPILQVIPDTEEANSLEEYRAVYQAEGVRSMLVVPLSLRNSIPDGPNAATITFYWREPHTFSDLDIAFASALANLSSAALNLAELQEQNQREKKRLAFLAEASAVLASSLDYEATLHRVADLAVAHIADSCAVHVIENGVPNRIVMAHADPSMLEFARLYVEKYPEQIREDRGLGYVLSTGNTEVIPRVTDEMLVAAIPDPEQREMVRRLRVGSSILVPLISRGKVLGAIRLVAYDPDQTFSQDDVRLAEDLARRAATAIENSRLHRAVLDQKDRLTLSHTAARMGTWYWDLTKQRITWSDEFRELHGLAHNSAPTTGTTGSGLIHPDDFERVLGELQSAMNSDEEFVSTEHRAVAGDGHIFWVHSRGRVERDAAGKAIAIVGITMDITERRQAEEALRKTEKLAAAGRLAATVAHEINNPLESIVNLVYLAGSTPGLPPEAAELLTSADTELARIAQIVRQTLGFYRESVEPRCTDICQLVSETLDVYRPRMEARSLLCKMDLDADLRAHVVPGELKQVVANLVANALDATEPGGSIQVSAKRDGETAAIAVADTGSGIEDAHLAHLFEPFFTTKADVGTGLGLWVSKGIVEKHQGVISVASSTHPVDHGTTFTVTLPLA